MRFNELELFDGRIATCLVLFELGAVIAALAIAAWTMAFPDRILERDVILLSAFAGVTAWIVVQDYRTFTIPDGGVLVFLALGAAGRVAEGDDIVFVLAEGALTGSAMLLFRETYYRLRGFDGLGLGDVKLSYAAGCAIGAPAFSISLSAASAACLTFAIVRKGMTKPQKPSEFKLALGVALAPAIYSLWIWQRLFLFIPASRS